MELVNCLDDEAMENLLQMQFPDDILFPLTLRENELESTDMDPIFPTLFDDFLELHQLSPDLGSPVIVRTPPAPPSPPASPPPASPPPPPPATPVSSKENSCFTEELMAEFSIAKPVAVPAPEPLRKPVPEYLWSTEDDIASLAVRVADLLIAPAGCTITVVKQRIDTEELTETTKSELGPLQGQESFEMFSIYATQAFIKQ